MARRMFGEQEAVLEMERRARERQEREQEASSGKGKRISTLHRDSDFTLECPDGRVSPPSAPTASRRLPLLPPPRGSGRSAAPTKTDVSVRYGPRRNGETDRGAGKKGGARERETEPALGEFERRLLNAKRLGKAPMLSVDQIP